MRACCSDEKRTEPVVLQCCRDLFFHHRYISQLVARLNVPRHHGGRGRRAAAAIPALGRDVLPLLDEPLQRVPRLPDVDRDVRPPPSWRRRTRRTLRQITMGSQIKRRCPHTLSFFTLLFSFLGNWLHFPECAITARTARAYATSAAAPRFDRNRARRYCRPFYGRGVLFFFCHKTA